MEEEPMKKSGLFFVILGFLVLSLAGVSYGWQGRMAGMGDPYGLIQDESDFLIHPAGIANGRGMNFYGDYRFTWNEVTNWNITMDAFSPGCTSCHNAYKNAGHEQKHQGLLGAAIPMGPGRMGLFLQYEGKRGDFDGHSDTEYGFCKNSLRSDLDSFILRLLYGLPMGAFKLGGEVQLAYRNEQNKMTDEYLSGLPGFWEIDKNNIYQSIYPFYDNLFLFMTPYDSQYWEALLKGSLEGMIGPVKMAFTMRGGFIFTGDNKLKFANYYPSSEQYGELDGNVKGWSTGGDLWLRYPLGEGLSLPFLLKVAYQRKARDGSGPYFNTGSLISNNDYKNVEKSFNVDVGGGIDKEIIKGTRVAAGIYYNYLKNKNNISVNEYYTFGSSVFWDKSSFPDQTEHRITLRLLGERELSPMVALRMGLNFFYGWVKEDLRSGWIGPSAEVIDEISSDGYRWGIGASLGGTVKFQQFSIEPFLGGGYQRLKLSGDGSNFNPYDPWIFSPTIQYDMKKTRSEWFIGGGLSIKFNR
jgi:hypothetical protein